MNPILSKEWRMNNLYRIIDRDGNSIKFKLNHIQKETLKVLHNRNLILKARQLGMCLDPNTKILKSDFSWICLKDIKVGDEIVSVDEHPRCRGSARKLRKSIVQAKKTTIRKTYKINFENGKSLICSGEHRWLARNSSTDCHWRSIHGEGKYQLKVGQKIRRIVTDTWEQGDYEDGWMGGMLDGEGSLAKKNRLGGNIGLSQVEGKVWNRLVQYFEKNDYSYRIEIDKACRLGKYGKRPVNKLVLSRTDEIFKLLGITRPSRFLKQDWWEGKKVPQIKSGNYSIITSIECIGEQELIDLQTSTKTFIAEGYVSHNSTFAVIYILDECLFTPNLNCGIVSYSIEHAQHIFKKIIGHALDCMDPKFRNCTGIIQRSAKEITFNNKSSLRVDTTLRGGAYQAILVSEFGKTCARYPIHAEEVVTGTLQAVSKKGKIIIESTAEGNEGYFADMCMDALQNKDKELSELDYNLIFWAWHHEKSYTLDQDIEKPIELIDYFKMLQEKHGIELTRGQKNWYASYYRLLGEKIRQEYPSTVEESFLVKSDAYFFSEGIELANREERMLYNTIYDPILPVYVAMDIGINHRTVIIYFQIKHGEVRVIDYYDDTNKDAKFYAQHLLQENKYFYQRIFIPHDVRKRSNIDLSMSWEKEFRKYFEHTDIKIIVLPRQDKQIQISHARNILRRCVFFMKRCNGLIKHLMKYRKKWSEQLGIYIDEPFDDAHADFADAFCYMARAVSHIEAAEKVSIGLEKHRQFKSLRKSLV